LSDPPEDRKSAGVSPFAMLGVGLEIAVPAALFILGGNWVDGRLGTRPLFLVLGAAVGMATGFYSLVRRVMVRKQGEDGKSD
jgi:F0F1-type ATP synthase assembly protein I